MRTADSGTGAAVCTMRRVRSSGGAPSPDLHGFQRRPRTGVTEHARLKTNEPRGVVRRGSVRFALELPGRLVLRPVGLLRRVRLQLLHAVLDRALELGIAA